MAIRNTEINFRRHDWLNDWFHQLVIPSERITDVYWKRVKKDILTGYDKTKVGEYSSGEIKVTIMVRLKPEEEMQFTESSTPIEEQFAPKDNYTIIDWLEIING